MRLQFQFPVTSGYYLYFANFEQSDYSIFALDTSTFSTHIPKAENINVLYTNFSSIPCHDLNLTFGFQVPFANLVSNPEKEL